MNTACGDPVRLWGKLQLARGFSPARATPSAATLAYLWGKLQLARGFGPARATGALPFTLLSITPSAATLAHLWGKLQLARGFSPARATGALPFPLLSITPSAATLAHLWGKLQLARGFSPARAIGALAFFLLLLSTASAAADYSADIAPLLEKRCGGCHGGEAKMGEFSITSYDTVKRGGNHGPGFIAGKPEESPLYAFITGKSYPKMPMDGTTLADGEVALIKAWIEAGAKGPSGAATRQTPAPSSSAATAAAATASIRPRADLKPQLFGLAWQPGAKRVALAGHRLVTIADSATGKSLVTFTGPVASVRNVAFSRDGKLIAAAGGICARKGEVKIWNAANPADPAVTIAGHDDCIYGLAFSPDSQLLATSSYDKLIKLWDTATGKEVRTLKDHIDAVYAVAFTPDGKRLVSCSADRGVKVWDVATGQRLYTFSDALDVLNTIAIDPTGKYVAAGGVDKSIRIWRMDATGGELLHSLMAHEDAILKLAWSPDGRTLVSSSADKSIKVLRAADLTELKRLAGQSDWAYGLDFSPDGQQLAVARMDGSYSVYETSQLTATGAAREVAAQ